MAYRPVLFSAFFVGGESRLAGQSPLKKNLEDLFGSFGSRLLLLGSGRAGFGFDVFAGFGKGVSRANREDEDEGSECPGGFFEELVSSAYTKDLVAATEL